jgi:DNA-binding MarR family transcriptional regulator
MAAPASSDVLPLLDQLVEQAYTFSAAIGRWSATILAELELTEALGDVLWQLGAVGEAVPMRDLADRLQCDPSNVTFLADRLEERGLIERRPDLSDRRVKLLALTTAGLAVRTRIVQAAATRSPLARLSPADQQRLSRLLDKCLQPEPPA